VQRSRADRQIRPSFLRRASMFPTRTRLISIIAVVVLSAIAQAQAPKVTSAFFTTTDGVKLHYVEAGTGQSIVLIPGFMMPAWIWENQMSELSKKYHVIAVDPRSQGDSDKPTEGNYFIRRAEDYRDLVDHLKLKNPVLVGWSMGVAELAYYAGHLDSGTIRGYVLVDGFLWDKQEPQLASGMGGWMLQMQQERVPWTDKFVRSMYKKPQDDAYIKRVEDAALKTPSNSASSLIYGMVAVQDWSPSLTKLSSKPVMFVYNPNMQKTADLLKSRIPAVRLEMFSDTGHALFVDDAPKFNKLVDDFVTGLK
jgi:non-heme chloroperoxidase